MRCSRLLRCWQPEESEQVLRSRFLQAEQLGRWWHQCSQMPEESGLAERPGHLQRFLQRLDSVSLCLKGYVIVMTYQVG